MALLLMPLTPPLHKTKLKNWFVGIGSKDIDWMFPSYHPKSVTESVAGKKRDWGAVEGGETRVR
jgi:hypothetical protein